MKAPKDLPPLSARAMAAVRAVQGGPAVGSGKSGRRLGPHSARGVSGEAKIKGGRAALQVQQQPSAMSNEERPASSKQLRTEVQTLMQNVQTMSARLSETEESCSKKASAAEEIQKALQSEVDQAEATRLEVRNARQRIEAFRSILGKAGRDRGSDVATGTSSSSSLPQRRNDEMLSNLCLAGAEAEKRMLMVE